MYRLGVLHRGDSQAPVNAPEWLVEAGLIETPIPVGKGDRKPTDPPPVYIAITKDDYSKLEQKRKQPLDYRMG